jgi:hypothetical protein
MSTTTRLFTTILVAASFGIALATGAAVLFDHEGSASDRAQPQSAYQQVHATIRTDWLAPVSARRSLDERYRTLERWVMDRGGYVRVLDNASALRARDAAGVRLSAPVARLARSLVIFVPQQQSADAVRALAGPNASVTVIAADGGARQPWVEF